MYNHLGVKRGQVKIVPYDSRWPEDFEHEKKLLKEKFGPLLLDILHVGSTAVPGLAAKPVIDISATIENLQDIDLFLLGLKDLDYTYIAERSYPNEDYKGRHFFVKHANEGGTHYLKLTKNDDQKDWIRLIQFRDYLKGHPEAANQYANLKMNLYNKHAGSREDYTTEKTEFIQDVFKKIDKTAMQYNQ